MLLAAVDNDDLALHADGAVDIRVMRRSMRRSISAAIALLNCPRCLAIALFNACCSQRNRYLGSTPDSLSNPGLFSRAWRGHNETPNVRCHCFAEFYTMSGDLALFNPSHKITNIYSVVKG